MPKNKKKAESSSSDSDEGPVDKTPPKKPAKISTHRIIEVDEDILTAVSKPTIPLRNPPEKKAKTSARTDDAEPTWALQGKKMVKVREFKGKCLIDIREYYEKNGELLPGKKGISLNPEQWRKLISVAEEVNEAITNAC